MNAQIKTIFLLGVLSALFIAFGGLFGEHYLWMFGVMAVLMNFGAYFFSDKIVLAMHGAREVTEREMPGLHRMIGDLAMRAGLPKPRVYVMDSPQPNAFATGRSPAKGAVAFTTGILNSLNERELRGVAAHELAHIRNRDILITTIAATIASAITYLADMARWGMIFGSRDHEEGESPFKTLVLLFLAPLAAFILQLAVSRSREYLADATGAGITGDPEGLASALTRISRAAEITPPAAAAPAAASMFIVNPFAGVGRGLLTLFSTHPPMEERIRRLRELSGHRSWMSAA